MAWQDDYVSPLRVVSGYDPALDDDKMDRKAYAATRDPSLVRELPGRKARWFVLSPLSVDDRLACDATPSAEAKFTRALIFGLASVEMTDESRVLLPTKEMPGRASLTWGNDDLATLIREFGMDVLYEIGVTIYARSGWGKGWACGAGSYPVPQALQYELDRIARQRAAATPAQPSAS